MTAPPDRNEWDLELVRRFQAGDESAFDRLVESHRVEVYRLAYRFAGNHADADDMVQEAFLKAYRSLGRFRAEATFRTWLTRIVLNLASDRKKRQGRRRKVPLDEVAEKDLPRTPGVEAPGLIRGEALHQAVRRLPPRQRETLILRIYQEMRFREIATVMGCTVGTAKANFFHALVGLRKWARGPASGPGTKGPRREGSE